MARLSSIEKLARDICWAEYPRSHRTATKAAYWQLIGSDGRAVYMRDAEWLVYITKKLKPLRILMLVDIK